MTNNKVNIDQVVDYKTEYSLSVEHAKITGDSIIGLCPFHDDKNASFSADLKTGKYNCFACGASGNFTTFYAKVHNLDSKDAYKAILEKYGVDLAPQKDVEKQPRSYTLAEYAFEKRIPEEWLSKQCHLSGAKEKDGTGYIRIPYYNEDQEEQLFRKRYHKSHIPRFKWKYGSAGKILMYGEWRLPAMRKHGYTIMVEGESDTQSLWFMGLSALGVPGASMFKPEWSEKLDGLKLYLHIEPDKGGQTFLQQMTSKLREGGFHGEVYTWSCKQFGCKDPSELYMKLGKDEAKEKIKEAIKTAEQLDLDRIDQFVPEVIKGAPIQLRQPIDFEYSNSGLYRYDEKSGTFVLFCRTPILITKRLQSTSLGTEKIEIAFKRDGVWRTAIYPRSTIFKARDIVALADLGCTITSENAKMVVKYLTALESENMEIISKQETTSLFGWQTDGSFLPGNSKLTLDIELSLQSWANAYQQNGSYEEWLKMIAPHRERDKFRFILASAFAAPLLKLFKQRIFIVYNWGGSKGGKTATLKAALSAWGDPDRLMINFNATQVALERMAGFYCDLPLGIDERQLADKNQNNLEKIVYMLASGTGRARGSKTGGLQTMHTWRTVAMMTGEEPITNDQSMTGVSTRVLELYGGPFDDEKSASAMHKSAVDNCGWAGPKFIEILAKKDEKKLIALYEDIYACVDAAYAGKNNSHITSIATVATADAIIDSWLFNDSDHVLESSITRAKEMATQIAFEQMASEVTDVNENAKNFIVDWILSNRSQFGDTHYSTSYGLFDESDRDIVWIYNSLLKNALENAGFSTRKTLRYLAEQSIIEPSEDKKTGKTVFSSVKWIGKKCVRMVKFNLGKAVGHTTEEYLESVTEQDELPFGPEEE